MTLYSFTLQQDTVIISKMFWYFIGKQKWPATFVQNSSGNNALLVRVTLNWIDQAVSGTKVLMADWVQHKSEDLRRV